MSRGEIIEQLKFTTDYSFVASSIKNHDFTAEILQDFFFTFVSFVKTKQTNKKQSLTSVVYYFRKLIPEQSYFQPCVHTHTNIYTF